MKQSFGIALAICALSVGPALAQGAGGAQGTSGTGTTGAQGSKPAGVSKTQGSTKAGSTKSGAAKTGSAASGASAGDTAFAKEAAIGGLAEVELGNLAKQKASSADVKQFGDRMVNDHGKANDELKAWAQQKNVTLPTELDAKHKATSARLAKLSGDAFDKAYMHDMVMDHQKDVAAFKRESSGGKDADLKAWAGKTLPTLQDHLKMSQDTASKVGAGAGAAGAKKTSTHAKRSSGKR